VTGLADLDIARVRADNPGPLTLSGTNSWVVGRDPAYVVDPGPELEPHLSALEVTVGQRGGLGGIAVTHGHADHTAAIDSLLDRCGRGCVVAGAGGTGAPPGSRTLADGEHFGPLRAMATPGHAPDHLAFLAGPACFTGDAVLGEGSVFIAPDPGAMTAYLAALRRLTLLDLDVLCPGHGPPVWDVAAHLSSYIAHRVEREGRLVAALTEGRRTIGELLDAAWADVAAELRPAAALTLAAHLDKLEQEGRLPPGVQRPVWSADHRGPAGGTP